MRMCRESIDSLRLKHITSLSTYHQKLKKISEAINYKSSLECSE
jgi:hypothetical protein